MKKIVSFLVVAMMLASLSLTAFAASATFPEVEVENGTATAVVDYTLTFDEAVSIGMLQINLVLPEGITLTDVDFSEFTALCGTITNDNNFEIGQLLVYDDDMDVPVEGDLTLKFTFAIADASTAAEYVIGIDEGNTMVIDPEGNPLIDTFPGTKITVKAAAPVVEYETVDLIGEAIAADTTSVADYTNYAIYANDFTAPADVEKVNALGFKVETKDDVTFDAAITGTVKYIVAYVGEGAADAVVKPFYNVTRVK